MPRLSRKLAYCFLATSLMLPTIALSADPSAQMDPDEANVGPEWKLIKEDKNKNIRAYLRKDSNYRLTVNRIEAEFKVPLSSLVAAVLDTENMTHWIWQLREAKVLKQNAPNDMYLYFAINGPYGVEDRDSVVRARVTQDPKTKVVTINTRSDPDYMPDQPPLVRMALLEMNWKLTPMADGKTQAEMIGVIDPGGKIPVWTANMVQKQGLYSSIKGLMRVAKQSKYQNPSLPFTIID